MLLTLSAHSFRAHLTGAKPKLTLGDLPKVAKDELGLNGLVVSTSYLAGWDLPKLEQFRDRADKAAAPCLLLVEDEPQRLGDADPAITAAAEDRLQRVLQVAHRLGCSGVAMGIKSPAGSTSPDLLAASLKRVVQRAERLELNLLLTPTPGVSETPEKLTGLIRKVGGFRIGAFPDFESAAATGDPTPVLRALTPYASVVSASFNAFDDSGVHKGYDFRACMDAVAGVGFDQTISLEYRGKGDPRESITRAKAAVEDLAAAEEAPKDDDSE